MGVSDFRKIRDANVEFKSITSIPQMVYRNILTDVCFDGSLYLYSGLIRNNMDGIDSYDLDKVADTVARKVLTTIDLIQHYKVRVGDVYIYFDGRKPCAKIPTMVARRIGRPIMDIEYVKVQVSRLLNNYDVKINNLIIGESEHEMFIHRNANRPTILVTDDSDIFHIAYNYDSRTVNDKIFVATKNLHFTCDMSTIYNNFNKMPKLIFTTLCAMRGCDYTPDLITNTMLNAIISEFKTPTSEATSRIISQMNSICDVYKKQEFDIQTKLAKLQPSLYNKVSSVDDLVGDGPVVAEYEVMREVYSIEDVVHCMRLIMMLLKCTKNSYRWNSVKIKGDNHSEESYKIMCSNVIASIHWTVNYSLIGCRYEDYFKKVSRPGSVEPFVIYYVLLLASDDIFKTIEKTSLRNIDKVDVLKRLRDG
nr:FEN-1 [Menippe mercenaria nudivirus]